MKNNFHHAGNIKKPPCKVLGGRTKNEEKFKKILRFFDKIFYGNGLFSILTNSSVISASFPKGYTPIEDQFSTAIFPISEGDSGVLPPTDFTAI